MIVVDTSVWIEFLKGKNHEISERFITCLKNRDVIALSPVFGELLQGVKNERERKIIVDFWYNLPKISEENAFIEAGELSNKYKLKDRGVGLVDAYILNVTLNNDFLIWTLDKKLQKVIDEIAF